MRISGIHNRRDLSKRKETSQKLSGKVLKVFKGTGRVAVLLPDGSTQLLQSDKNMVSGETVYFNELDLLGEFQHSKKDSTELMQDKVLTSSDLILLISNLKEDSPLTPLLKELASLLKKGEITKEIQHKINAILERVKAIFPSHTMAGGIERNIQKLLSNSGAIDGISGKDFKGAEISEMLTVLEKELVSLLVDNATEVKGKEVSIERTGGFVKALVQSALQDKTLNADILKTSLFLKLPAEEIKSVILPALATSQTKLKPLVSLITAQITEQQDLYLFPSPARTSELSTQGTSSGVVPMTATSETAASAPLLLHSDFAFTALFATLTQEYPAFTKALPVELLVDVLLMGKGVDKECLQRLHDEVLTLLDSGTVPKERIADALQKTVAFLGEDSSRRSPVFTKEVFYFHLQGGKEMPQQISMLREQAQSLLLQPNLPFSSPRKEMMQSWISSLLTFEEVMAEPGMSTIIKKEGISSLLSQLGVIPQSEARALPQSAMSLKEVAESILQEVQRLELQVAKSDKDSWNENETIKKMLSSLKEKGREILKTVTTLSLLAKPLEKSSAVDQTIYLPVRVGAEEVTVQLTVRREKGAKKGRRGAIDGTQVEIAMELKKLGHIESRLQLTANKKLSVALTSGKSSVVQWFRDNLREMYASLENSNLSSVSLIIDGVKPFQERSNTLKKSRIEFTG